MSDPFRVLRAPAAPADPDPAFAARLRARLERALGLPEGVAVSQMPSVTQPGHAPDRGGNGATRRGPRQGDVGYASLWVPDTGRAVAFYTAVLGWRFAPEEAQRARQVVGSVPPQGVWGGQPRSTLFCSYVVDDAVATVARVRAAGGRATGPEQRPYGLTADCTDDQGVRFAVHQAPAAGPASGDVPAAARDGDLAYITLEVVDSRRARDFYGAVLGWRFQPGRIADGWQVEGTTPMIGISGGHQMATAVPMWRVEDLIATAGRVRAAGGSAGRPSQEPYGLTADCTDDQGTRFHLGQFPAR
jgi:predicted enzyme related to lactoylglutathione lyase